MYDTYPELCILKNINSNKIGQLSCAETPILVFVKYVKAGVNKKPFAW